MTDFMKFIPKEYKIQCLQNYAEQLRFRNDRIFSCYQSVAVWLGVFCHKKHFFPYFLKKNDVVYL